MPAPARRGPRVAAGCPTGTWSPPTATRAGRFPTAAGPTREVLESRHARPITPIARPPRPADCSQNNPHHAAAVCPDLRHELQREHWRPRHSPDRDQPSPMSGAPVLQHQHGRRRERADEVPAADVHSCAFQARSPTRRCSDHVTPVPDARLRQQTGRSALPPAKERTARLCKRVRQPSAPFRRTKRTPEA